MAQTPGKFQYVLDGKGVGFINSDDNKIKITGYAPVADVDETGVVYPTTGALTLSGQSLELTGIAWPTTGALTFTGTIPVFDQPITVDVGSLALSGKTPDLGAIAKPSVVSLTLTEQDVERPTGLKLESESLTTVIAEVELPLVGSMSFASVAPDVESSSATAITRVPETKSVTLGGNAPASVVANVVLPDKDTLTIQGRLSYADPVQYPAKRSLAITGYAPDAPVIDVRGQVTVLIEGPFEYGTFIRNKTATTDVPVNYQIDDRTGFKVKVKDVLIEEYTGSLVRPESLDKRSEQEFLRSKSDGGRGPKRPEPVGNERHIDEEYPDGVSADDL